MNKLSVFWSFLLIFSFSFCASAQQELNNLYVDSATYQQLINKQYKELKQLGKAALQQSIDFYDLRMRLGMVHYEEKNFDESLTHFERAYGMNPANEILQEYLYYAYLLSDRAENANEMGSKMSATLQKKVKYRKKIINHIGIGIGTLVNDNITSNQNRNFKNNPNSRAETILFGNVGYLSVFAQHTIKNRFQLTYSANIFKNRSLALVQLPVNQVSNSSEFTNNQANIGLSYVSQKGFVVSVGFGYFNENFATYIPSQPLPRQFPVLIEDGQTLNTFMATLSVGKRFKYIEPLLSLTANNLNGVSRYQSEFTLVYYPFGNSYFYGATSGAYLFVNNNLQDQLQYVVGQKFGAKLLSMLWGEVSASYGNHINYVTNGGFLVLNTPEPIVLNTGINFKIFIDNLEFIPSYSFQLREKSILQFPNSAPNTAPIIQKTNHLNHIFNLTVKCNF